MHISNTHIHSYTRGIRPVIQTKKSIDDKVEKFSRVFPLFHHEIPFIFLDIFGDFYVLSFSSIHFILTVFRPSSFQRKLLNYIFASPERVTVKGKLPFLL